MALLLVWPLGAFATELDDVRAELDAKAGDLQKITEQIDKASDEVAALEDEIGDLVADIEAHQAERAEIQKNISALSKVMYKNVDQLDIINIFTSAESLSDVVDKMEVRRKLLTEYITLADEQQRMDAELQISYREVSEQKNEQTKKLAELKDKQDELKAIVTDLQGREAELNAAEQAALAAAAEAEARAMAAAEDAYPQPEGAGYDEDADGQGNPWGSPDAGWTSGAASAYGGSTDDTDDPTVPTATGTYVDDYSMGVAVPMAWGPEEYYGRSVEITYNGVTVVATVTDCGGMNGGERSLDLQPGVWKSLGFDSCDDWGVRDVQYRFL